MQKRHVAFFSFATIGLFTWISTDDRGSVHTADAAPAALAAPQAVPVKKAAVTCPWTTAMPALPPGCTAAPTLAQCSDPNWHKTGCGANKALAATSKYPTVPIIDQYCHKAFADDFCKDPNAEALNFPGPAVRASPISVLKPSTNKPLFVPAGHARGGRQVAYVPIGKNGLKGPAPKASFSGIPTSTSGGPWTQTARSSAGSFESALLPGWVGRYNTARVPATQLHFAQLQTNPSATINTANDQLFNLIALDGWVGDGTDSPPHREVNSCIEHTYQRWYDYTRFKNAAKALGHDYRAIYNLAFSPTYNLEKAQLKQFAIGDIPSAWPTSAPDDYQVKRITRNPFVTVTPSFAPGFSTALKAQIMARTAANQVIKIPAGQDTSRFALHKLMSSMMERKYHLTDDALAERSARMQRYSELLSSRSSLTSDYLCAAMADRCCNGDPVHNGPSTNKVLDELRGVTVSNPDPTKISDFGAGSIISTYAGFQATDRAALDSSVLTVKGNQQALGAAGMRKNKTLNVVTSKQPVASTAPVQSIGGMTCVQKLTARLPYITAALSAVRDQLSGLIEKEYTIPDGCLEDKGSELGNSCDWSYEQFAHLTMTYFDEKIEQDSQACTEASGGDFKTVRNPDKQSNIWPPELRHDFGADQLDVQYFVDAYGQRAGRESCELQRATKTVENYLEANKTLLAQIPINSTTSVGQTDGDDWSIGDTGTFEAHASYSLDWKLTQGAAKAKLANGAWCHPNGSAAMTAKAGIYFFGSPRELFNAGESETTHDTNTTYGAHARMYDLESGSEQKLFAPITGGSAFTPPRVAIPYGDPQLLGDIGYDIWFSIGPIPIHINFGANASTGVDISAIGHAANANSCSGGAGQLEFRSGTSFEPWVEADAYADASIDLLIVSAGIRMDLTLLRIGLPVGVDLATSGPNIDIGSGCHLTTDALNGSVSAYVEIGIDPFSYTIEATLFSWDGLHSDLELFGKELKGVPLQLIGWATDPVVTKVDALHAQHPAQGGTTFTNHPWCLRSPIAPKTADPANCNTWASPSTTCAPYYAALRGPTK